MINPQQLLPIVKGSFKKGSDEQILEALNKLAKAHPELSNAQAAAALQQYIKGRVQPSMGNLARTGRMVK
jgi:hypothetical protein